MRREGFYKVQLRSERDWNIGFYDARFKSWHLVGDTKVYYDKEFLNINEEQIKVP